MTFVGDLVNAILHRKPAEESYSEQPSANSSVPLEQKMLYAAATGKSRPKAERNLLGMLPAPLDSGVYVTRPVIKTERRGKGDWSSTTSYQLREDAQLPKQVVPQEGLAAKVSRTPPPAPVSRPVSSPARAVPARGTGYTPSALEEQMRNSTLNQRHYR